MESGILNFLMRGMEAERLFKMMSGPASSGRPGYTGRSRGKATPKRSRPNRLHASCKARARHKRRAA